MNLMGLLSPQTGDPEKDAALRQGLLATGLSLLGARGKFGPALGQGGLQGLNVFQQTMQQAGENKRRDLQTQALQQQLETQRRLDQRQTEIQGLAPRFVRTPTQQGLADGAAAGSVGPTVQNAQRAAASPGGFDFAGYSDALAAHDPGASLALKASLRKDNTPIKVGDGEALIDPTTLKPLFQNPKADKEPDVVRAMRLAGIQEGSPQWRQGLESWIRKQSTHAPGTNVNVNTGQKGFDNTLKLRGDFRSEPVYKAHQEMQSAYSQIQQALRQASPAGDLAGATKVMKLLDPGSVVHESELGMAMAASGPLDRLQNYAGNVMNGTKLTPTQRADFQKLANALYGESVKHYNAKRSEYQGIAERNQLSVPDVLGAPSLMPGLDQPPAGGGNVLRFDAQGNPIKG